MRFLKIQNDVIHKYNIDICNGNKCKNDWGRTHAHVKERRVCKWNKKNSVESTFTLLHEIGHILTTKSTMRRAESEYFATVWAITEAKKYYINIPEKQIILYQEYINREKERGLARGGKNYDTLTLIQ